MCPCPRIVAVAQDPKKRGKTTETTLTTRAEDAAVFFAFDTFPEIDM
jgi:hypothetical protein